MNGIDTGAAALLASRIAALTPVGPQGASGAAQTGVSALATGTAALADTAATTSSTQDSAQTVLSAVALALDAIIRSGGEATPAVVGSAPLWANPDADAAPGGAGALPLPGLAGEAAQEAQAAQAALLADVALAAQGLAGDALAAAADTGTGTAAQTASSQDPQAGQTTQTAQTAQTAAAAQAGPVAALAASLAQTVSSSGLFYEAHLAQWLRGQLSPAELADEPQNRLLGAHAQLPLDWSHDADDIDDVQWTETFADAPGGAHGDAGNASNAASAVNAALARAFPGLADLHGDAASATAQTQARAALADTLLPAMHEAAAQAAGPSVHPAVIPLVRQQLDLLATGEFRWNGEAWPGVRVDWSIQQDDYDERDAHAGTAGVDADDIPWRTRLTLALPKLGTVDAELTLTGATLAVRVQASVGGATRLSAESESLRGRLEALGLTLAGLSIREIGSGAAASPAEAARAASAASAYAAQTTSAAAATQAAPDAPAAGASADANDHRNHDQNWEL
ncbi:flagellar hook-length control protein FliK [Paraburkholderia acidiphila]|uniref:Flagellar hook-length control protein FliK n=1 Tax=Paraburkholderia acidiphila TaxID=2571747 RepID=A0A7Z2J8N9_9BURK|nr:flagellar hook-length control protein FliK [Paraburkholderia acidiphila]QGZ55867.1 flagellar hook-length control protein FliK [Paraburkholderia acidiphila]